jgi:hypothetical protein
VGGWDVISRLSSALSIRCAEGEVPRTDFDRGGLLRLPKQNSVIRPDILKVLYSVDVIVAVERAFNYTKEYHP